MPNTFKMIRVKEITPLPLRGISPFFDKLRRGAKFGSLEEYHLLFRIYPPLGGQGGKTKEINGGQVGETKEIN
jgi:hypothetical protein